MDGSFEIWIRAMNLLKIKRKGNSLLKPGTAPKGRELAAVWGEQKGSSIPPTAGLPSSLPAFQRGRLIATYFYVRLIPRDFGRLVPKPF